MAEEFSTKTTIERLLPFAHLSDEDAERIRTKIQTQSPQELTATLRTLQQRMGTKRVQTKRQSIRNTN